MPVYINATANRLIFGTGSQYTVGSAMTVGCWFKLDNIIADRYLGARWNSVDGQRCWVFLVRNTTGKLDFIVSGNGIATKSILATNGVSAGVWNHVVCRYDGAYIYLDVNGSSAAAPVAWSSGILEAVAASVTIGALAGAADTLSAKSSIFDFRMYTRYLSDAECYELYAAKGRDSVFDSNMALRTCIKNGYAGNSLLGQIVHDHSINKNNITVTGAPTVTEDPYSTVKPPVFVAR